ncbi:MAG: manganese efflux pump MntP family protein [Bacteroidales bacterium]|jgi:putative Mn2+ efflux pump MntP|nr:manganese efflux pump MntP family protein [Bacteroidales bacterium]MDD2686874.1 manganese efflux pump MntP family protein [Bacteroidales bacterium]MDD3329781.1 manganese efflux pump MntP family protein [Bacteroidales bacterium]MDD3690608.1 manganese efflux pump MntP family protein [Bacteroidales bacterium]MDD4044026.1 manganese efflux pump MntP family protein [Bacteroidales bacterium]
MDVTSIIFIAIGLAMDSFAVSISIGSCSSLFRYKQAFLTAFIMGAFQALMPVVGWALAFHFAESISDFDHWIAFILLSYLGGKMIYESFQKKDKPCIIFSLKTLLILGIATSIDALAIGISFAFLNINIILPVIIIGLIAFLFSFAAVFIGFRFGKLKIMRVELIGGLILIAIGTKILIEHMF